METTTPSCYWSEWQNSDKPKLPYRDDNETFAHINANGGAICENPSEIECRPAGGSASDFVRYQEWQVVSCDVNSGLICRGTDQTTHPICENYEIRVYCCDSVASDPALEEVHQIQSQVQTIIDGIESGDVASEGKEGGLLADLIHAKHDETKMDQELQNLLGSLNEEAASAGTMEHQVQIQHQVQHQIQNLNTEVEEEAEAHHHFQTQVQKQFGGIAQSVENLEMPEQLESAIDTMITDFKKTAQHSVVAEEHEQQQLKSAMEKLANQKATSDSEIKVLVEKTGDSLAELEKNHENLLKENKDLLGAIEGFNVPAEE